jgi:5-amino-6-(5-phosphoribosylamino)uracil reductase
MTSGLRLQQLLPTPGDVDASEVYGGSFGPAHPDRPHVTVNMVASVDGGTAVEGRTGVLSSPADKALFLYLRTLPDVVLVGAQTVRAEGYGTVKASEEVRTQREARGQAPAAALAVVTRSLDLDWSSRLFTEATQRPFVLAPADAPPDRLAQAEQVATVIRAGAGAVDLGVALGILRREHDVSSVLCEGGPTLNTQLAGGLLDQLCLTVSPALVGGASKTILADVALVAPLGLTLVSALAAGSELFLRYRVDA